MKEARKYLEEGLSLYGEGKVEEAKSRWRKVLELEPLNRYAREYLNFLGESLPEGRPREKEFIPRLLISPEDLVHHELDRETAYVVSLVDGILTWEEIIAASSLPPERTEEILENLTARGIIGGA